MKKFLLAVFVVALFGNIVTAQEKLESREIKEPLKSEETITYYDVYSHEDLASNVLLGWGGLSFVGGGVMAFAGDRFARGMGIQNMLWGMTDAGIALWIKNTAEERKNIRNREEEEKWFRDLLAVNFYLDFVYVAVGSGMLVWGNEDIKGHGAGIITQGLFLITFDGVNWILSNNLGNRFKSN